MTPEERERLRKQRLWEAHVSDLEAKQEFEKAEKARLKRNAAKRAYNKGYRAKVRLSPQAYQHALEQKREYNRKYRAAHKNDPVWKQNRREYAREWYHRPENRQKQHDYYLRWKEENPEAYAAKLEKNRQRRKEKRCK